MKVTPPKLPAMLEPATANQLTDESSLEGCRFEDADWSAIEAASVSLDEVMVERSLFSEARLEKFTARDTIFKSCDFSATHSPEISLQRVSLHNGRLTGWDCNKGIFKDVTFTDCKFDTSNFRFTKLTRVKFVNCIMTDADFIGAELQDVDFERCLLERTDFNQSKLKQVDLRSSDLIGLKGWRHLNGAIIDHTQLMTAAPYLADEIGLTVLD